MNNKSQKRYCEETKPDPVASTLNIINFAEWLKHTTKKNGGHYSANSIKSYTQATVDLNKLHSAEGKCTLITPEERMLLSQASCQQCET
ncbi:hypothetical protein O9G_005949 [Rozella allomycis CSF55]|uniref:Uncharacterized protein n=1 Tax=Rozella allomycis (strain CSF55) TaxID=988480 RepID=A0A075B3U6_ROZAC|nr:hypothetical protein O9G_005949 [Rozella allomycis CSF55]|eukprot:EPZ35578.1 hypothetical protein O9G_005949 [Rozella allomycis CSF55]